MFEMCGKETQLPVTVTEDLGSLETFRLINNWLRLREGKIPNRNYHISWYPPPISRVSSFKKAFERNKYDDWELDMHFICTVRRWSDLWPLIKLADKWGIGSSLAELPAMTKNGPVKNASKTETRYMLVELCCFYLSFHYIQGGERDSKGQPSRPKTAEEGRQMIANDDIPPSEYCT
jgi:hypothetical protein